MKQHSLPSRRYLARESRMPRKRSGSVLVEKGAASKMAEFGAVGQKDKVKGREVKKVQRTNSIPTASLEINA